MSLASVARRTGRTLTGIGPRLLLFNALLVFLPVAGVLFLDTYEGQLLAEQERSMVEQGRVLAAALSERGDLQPEDVRPTLVQLRQRSKARIRVVDPEGRVLGDTSLLGPRAEADADDAYGPRGEGWLYRIGALPFRIWRKFGPPRPAHGSADVYTSGGPLDGQEIRAALAGRYGAATRISSGGQRSVTLYSALPITDAGEPVGAVLVSQSTYRILRALYRVRLDVLRVFIASLAGAVVLSLLMSRTIARPLVKLRNQAETLLDRGRLRGRFETSQRRDEIGDLARSLEALRARLEAHIRGVEGFASDVSHEFKNPLASIRTASEMLAEVDDPAERKRFAGVVAREVARLEELLSAVREISRLDAGLDDGLDDAQRRSIDLRELIAGVVEAHRLRGDGEVSVSGPAELRTVASPERLARAVANLLDNAASFSPPGAAVEIALADDPDALRISVLDRGPGIPEEHLGRIFDRFFSYRPAGEADARTQRSDSGTTHTGLGLAIARALVEGEGGRLEAANRSDGGTRFDLVLPRTRDAT